MKLKRFFGIGAATLTAIAGFVYWYVFIDGVEQIDGPNAMAAMKHISLRYQMVAYPSKVMGMSRNYGLVLPPGYYQKPDQRYPVIFLLHGGHGDATAWFKKANALSVIQQLYDSHRLPPSIIITPDGNDVRGTSPLWDPDYINGRHGRVMSAIGDELVHIVQTRYRAETNPKYWAIGGLSSGGWGAVNIGLHYPQHFSILFSHSGYFKDKSGPYNSPITYVTHLHPSTRRHLSIYLDAGRGDHRFLSQSRQFHDTLDQLGVDNVFNAFPGGHGLFGGDVGWNYWHKHLADSLSFVGDRFRSAS
jgi:enterochelin esterase-like enzyme